MELQEHHAVVVGALRLRFLHTADRGKRALQNVGYLAFNLFGAGARIGGDHRQIRDVHIGQKVGLHFGQGNAAQDKANDNQHDDDVGTLHAESTEHERFSFYLQGPKAGCM